MTRCSASASADSIWGVSGLDQIHSNTGADKLYGGDQSDRLFGDDGSDLIVGNLGGDWLFGGLGRDTLTGGTGADRFVFRSASEVANDTITDFARNIDKLDFSGLSFHFSGTGPFSGQAGELRFSPGKSGGVLSLDLDGDGNADATLWLAGVSGLGSSDFIL